MRKALVDHTRQAHEDLHVHPRMIPLTDGRLSKAYYGALLADYHAFYQAVEKVQKTRGWHRKLALNRQVVALSDDLTLLGQPVRAEQTYTPSFQNQAECLGALYVLIGAQFGGHIIGKQIKTALPGVTCQYFSRHNDDIEQWRQLLATLEALPEHGSQRQATLIGARKTFDDFGRFLAQAPQSTS